MEEKTIAKRGRKKKEIDKTFSERLSKLLKDKKEQGIIQDDVAKSIGVSRQALGKWANGETVPDILDLKSLAVYFNVSSDYLLGLSELSNGDISLTNASKLTNISEKSLLKLSEIYLDDLSAKYMNILIQNDYISKMIDDHIHALAALENFNIITYCLWNGGIASVSKKIRSRCGEISLQSIQQELIRECKESNRFYAIEAWTHLQDFFNATTDLDCFNKDIEQLSKELYGYFLVCNDNKKYYLIDDKGQYINNDIRREIIKRLENENISCEDVISDFKVYFDDEIKEAPGNGNNNSEDK